jgi:alkaline phosphatase
VTADHSHTLTFAGYPVRGNPILGKVVGGSGEGVTSGPFALDATGLPYTTLGYANGPGHTAASASQPEGPKHFPHPGLGYQPGTTRPDLTGVDSTDPNYMQESTVPLASETHGGEDVGVWASGPGSDAVRGTLEQHVLFHVIVQATPALRSRLCDVGTCNADGVPVVLPDPGRFSVQ